MGGHVVSGSRDKTVRLWDAATAQPFGQPIGHGDNVLSVASTPDGRRIITGGADGTVRVLPGSAAVWRDQLCAIVTQNMSHKQWRDWVSPDIDYIKACPDLPIAPD